VGDINLWRGERLRSEFQILINRKVSAIPYSMRYFGRQEYRDLNSTGVDNAGNIEISYLCYQRPPLCPGSATDSDRSQGSVTSIREPLRAHRIRAKATKKPLAFFACPVARADGTGRLCGSREYGRRVFKLLLLPTSPISLHIRARTLSFYSQHYSTSLITIGSLPV
jgi:hypothetical protein